MKSVKYILAAGALVGLLAGCYWMAEQSTVEVSIGVPRTLVEKGDPVYYAYFGFADPRGETDVLEASVAMPSFRETSKRGVLVFKAPPGTYDLTMRLVREDRETVDYEAKVQGVVVMPQVLVTVELVLVEA